MYFVSSSRLNHWGIRWAFAPIEHWLSRPERAAAFNIISPVIFLGALVSVILLNLAPLVSLGRALLGNDAIPVLRLKIKYWNLFAVGLSLLLTLALVGYAFVENVASHGRL
ncbi:MAG: hypothetical protein JOY93_03870 [Acidobacteriales bacterium]|nr:hypothetical protein [Terriglobales bacterium]